MHTMHLRLYIFDVKKKMEEGASPLHLRCTGTKEKVKQCGVEISFL